MTFDEIEILEEITYISSQTGDRFCVVLPGGTSAKHEALSAEEMTSSVQEEKKHFVIRSVVDLRDDTEVSLQEAITAGIIDPPRGVFVDLSTGKAISIPLAMSEGLIRVEYVSTRRSAERKEALGLITIRTQIDRRGGYVVTGAVDSLTAERIDADEARRRGIILSEDDEDWFVVVGATATEERIPLVQAIDQGWVTATYEDRPIDDEEDEWEEPQVEVHTYAVSEVRDPANAAGATVSFAEAVSRGLIDRDTGDYVNAVTGERVPVVDAIRSGALKATLVEDVAGLNVSPSHSVVVDRVKKMNRRVFRGSAGGLQKEPQKKEETKSTD